MEISGDILEEVRGMLGEGVDFNSEGEYGFTKLQELFADLYCFTPNVDEIIKLFVNYDLNVKHPNMEITLFEYICQIAKSDDTVVYLVKNNRSIKITSLDMVGFQRKMAIARVRHVEFDVNYYCFSDYLS